MAHNFARYRFRNRSRVSERRDGAGNRKHHHMPAGVGHYGVFSGKTWQQQIYPMVKNVILQSD